MAESFLGIILEMLQTLIFGSLDTVMKLAALFDQLSAHLGLIAGIGGPTGILLAGGIFALVVFFLGKYIIGLGKGLMILILLAIIMVIVLISFAA